MASIPGRTPGGGGGTTEPQSSVETITLSADGSISPSDKSVNPLTVQVDAGGAARTIQGIDGVASQGQVVIIQHTGGENLTLAHNNGSASNPLLNTSELDEILDANREVAAYMYEGNAWRMVWNNIT